VTDIIFRGSIIINRPILEIYNYVEDVRRISEWYPFYADVEVPSHQPVAGVLRFRATLAFKPFPIWMPAINVDLIDATPGRRLSYRSLDIGATTTINFQPAVRGTLVSVTQTLWGWQAAVFGLVVQPLRLVANDLIMQTLTSLKHKAEGRNEPIHPLVFFNYRRSHEYVAGRIYDALCQDFGLGYVFKDFDSIKAGHPWRQKIGSALQACKVIIAHIPDKWEDEIVVKIDKTDWVRDELETALAHEQTDIIPVFTSTDRYFNMETRLERIKKKLPDHLKIKARLDAHQGLLLRADPDFRYDLERLLQAVWDKVQAPVYQERGVQTWEHAGAP